MADPRQVDEDTLDAIHEGHLQQLDNLCGCRFCTEYRRRMEQGELS